MAAREVSNGKQEEKDLPEGKYDGDKKPVGSVPPKSAWKKNPPKPKQHRPTRSSSSNSALASQLADAVDRLKAVDDLMRDRRLDPDVPFVKAAYARLVTGPDQISHKAAISRLETAYPNVHVMSHIRTLDPKAINVANEDPEIEAARRAMVAQFANDPQPSHAEAVANVRRAHPKVPDSTYIDIFRMPEGGPTRHLDRSEDLPPALAAMRDKRDEGQNKKDKKKPSQPTHDLSSVYVANAQTAAAWTALPALAGPLLGRAAGRAGVLLSAGINMASVALRNAGVRLLVASARSEGGDRLTAIPPNPLAAWRARVAAWPAWRRARLASINPALMARLAITEPMGSISSAPPSVNLGQMNAILREQRSKSSVMPLIARALSWVILTACRLRTVAVPICTLKLDPSEDEFRSTYLRLNRPVDEGQDVVAYRVYDTAGPHRIVIACPDMVQNNHIQCIDVAPQDRVRRMRLAGSRVGNLNIAAGMMAEVVEGSAVLGELSLHQSEGGIAATSRIADLLGPASLALSVTLKVVESCGWAARTVSKITALLTRPITAMTTIAEEYLSGLLLPVLGPVGTAVVATALDAAAHGPAHSLTKLLTHWALNTLDPDHRLVAHVLLNLTGAGLNWFASTGVSAIRLWIWSVCTLLLFGKAVGWAAHNWVGPAGAYRAARRWLRRSPLVKAVRSVTPWTHQPPFDQHWCAVGYRACEVTAARAAVGRDVSVKIHNNFYDVTQPAVVQRGIGPSVLGMSPPIPDTGDPVTMLDGTLHRVARETPPIDYLELNKFFGFIVKEAPGMLNPVVDQLTLVEWLPNCHYDLRTQLKMMETMDDVKHFFQFPKDAVREGHGKRETNLSFKTARSIIALTTVGKCVEGPMAKTMEQMVYRIENFIKHVPGYKRAEWLTDRFKGTQEVYETDFTSFESGFREPIMLIECWIYSYLLSWHPQSGEFLTKILSSQTTVKFKWYTLKMTARRMSGEMVTSLGNGLMNLFLCLYIGADRETLTVEGDDGLFTARNGVDTSRAERLGFSLKIERRPSVLKSSFCGMMMSKDGVSFTNPRKVLLNFGWSHSPLVNGGKQMRRRLLRAKALSLLYEHPQCPILFVLSRRMIELTSGVDPLFDKSYWTQHLLDQVATRKEEIYRLNSQGPSYEARCEFDECYGITVAEQIEIEEYIASHDETPMENDAVFQLFCGPAFADVHKYSHDCVSLNV